MFGIFGRSKRVVGIDIKGGHIRFLEIEKNLGASRITAYGEVTFEGQSPDEATLVKYFRDIKSNLKTNVVRVSIPVGSDDNKCALILKSAGLKVEEFSTPKEALEQAVIPDGANTSFLVVDAEQAETNFLIWSPNVSPTLYTSDSANHTVISNLNRLYIDWYDRHKERINHILISGARASDREFLEYVSRETKIPITAANVFTNMQLDQTNVPMIPKNESYKYAVAMGLTLN